MASRCTRGSYVGHSSQKVLSRHPYLVPMSFKRHFTNIWVSVASIDTAGLLLTMHCAMRMTGANTVGVADLSQICRFGICLVYIMLFANEI